MRSVFQPFAILLPLLLLTGVGCSGGKATSGTVNGRVTLDGQPLKQGVVRFIPLDGKSPTASAVIADGQFSTSVPLGEMRVEFSASKVVGKHKAYDAPDSPVVDDVVELIPARYNTNSQQRITVKQGSQEESFALTSK
jgi:hypothetical protein